MNKIILVGRAASGKDHLRQKLESKNWKFGIPFTTRPIRNGEIDGVDYYFISISLFKEMINKKEFVEYCVFNNWYYGTSNQTWNNSNLFIMTVAGLKQLKKHTDLSNSFIIYLNIDENISYNRLLERNDADSAKRRFLSDQKDFKKFNTYDISISNANF